MTTPDGSDELKRILLGHSNWVDSQHIPSNNGSFRLSEEEAEAALARLIADREKAAVQKFAYDIQRKVKLEFEMGGRYPGHIIDPWTDVARPIIYAKAQLKKGETTDV